jgi:hypothetical protein
MEDAKMRHEKFESRRIHAKELKTKLQAANEKEGVKVYSQYVKEVEQRIEE